MARLASRVDTQSAQYVANFTAMQQQVAALRELLAQTALGGPPAARERHRARGRLLVRERLACLLDPGATLLELSPLAAHGCYGGAVPGAGIVTGIGPVAGRDCVIIANDPTVKGGTYYPLTVKKHLRAQEIAAQNRLPCIYLVESGGAFLPAQDEVFPDREHFGRIFYNESNLSADGVAQLAVVHGNCTAGGAYVPALADQNVIVQGHGQIFLGGPALVKAATGEVVAAEALGGARVHARQSGVVDHVAEDDAAALAIVRRLVTRLRPPGVPELPPAQPPAHDPTELYGIVNANLMLQYDVREVIARLVDASDFDEFKAQYGTTLVCGFARWCGFEVGIIANNGVLFSESALKATHFIELCAREHTPLVFLQNIMGFMVGSRAEAGGIAKDGAKMVAAVSCARVPKFTVMIGGSFGAGNYAMCGRAFGPRLLFEWPNARTSVMGGEQAARVLATIRGEMSDAEKESLMAPIRAQYDQQGAALYATARLWDDGVIDPLDTRRVIGLGLAAARHAPVEDTRFGVLRM
jgi:3-methylcrotonyl-CoA carboxylase beta subunit